MSTGAESLRVRRLGGDRAGEIRLTRFLRNAAVTTEAMVATAAAETTRRVAGRAVLAIQDTTVIRSEGGGGLYLHPVLVVDADDGAILGLAHGGFLSRTSGKTAERRLKPVADKESQRWLDGAARAAGVCAGAARLTVVADRESDIYSAFALRPAGCDLLVRAALDRALADGGQLFAVADGLPVAGRAELDLPGQVGRKARTAQIAVRFMTASLKRPRNGVVIGLPEAVAMTLVDVREVDPPAGEKAVHWRLLTTHAVADAADALAIAALYRRRWAIEQVFRTMKTKGFDVEGVLIADEAPLCRLIMATLIAAVTIQQLVHARDGATQDHPTIRPMTDAFEPEDRPLLEAFTAELEGKTERQTSMPVAPSPTGPGSAPASVDGPAITENLDLSSCSRAGKSSNKPSTAPPSWPTTPQPAKHPQTMCESDSPPARGNIAFVRLPKTGGSSIIAAFLDRLGQEACLAFSATIGDRDFGVKRFVAGHVYLGDVTGSATVFTFVRDPVFQIASHLLWLDHYTMPEFEDEARSFSSEIRGVFAAVNNVDFSSARSLSAFLEAHPRDSDIRLANVQAEILSFRRGAVDPVDDAELARRAIAAFSRLDFVGVTEHLAADLSDLFRLLGLAVGPKVRHLNASPAARRIDLAMPAIRRALEAHVGADFRLWEAASALRERRLRAA